MITAKEATDLISKNTVAEWLEKISKEIQIGAINGNNFTQVKIPSVIAEKLYHKLSELGFQVCLTHGEYLDISWPRP